MSCVRCGSMYKNFIGASMAIPVVEDTCVICKSNASTKCAVCSVDLCRGCTEKHKDLVHAFPDYNESDFDVEEDSSDSDFSESDSESNESDSEPEPVVTFKTPEDLEQALASAKSKKVTVRFSEPAPKRRKRENQYGFQNVDIGNLMHNSHRFLSSQFLLEHEIKTFLDNIKITYTKINQYMIDTRQMYVSRNELIVHIAIINLAIKEYTLVEIKNFFKKEGKFTDDGVRKAASKIEILNMQSKLK